MTRAFLLCMVAVGLIGGPAAAQVGDGSVAPSKSAPDGPEDRARGEALTGVIAGAIFKGSDAERGVVMAGLRRLRDPALAPLFLHAALSKGVSPQLHGMLGLAELEPGKGLDLLAVRQLPNATWRSLMVLEASNAGLLDDSALAEVGSWTDLEPGVRVQLSARAVGRGQGCDAEPLRALLDNPDAELSLLAAAVLKQSSGDGAADRVLRTRYRAVLAGGGESVRRVAGVLGSNRITAGAGALSQMYDELAPKDPLLADEVLVAWLTSAPGDEAVAERVSARLGGTRAPGDRAVLARRVADAALLLGDAMPQSIGERLAGDKDVWIASLGRAVHAISIGCGSSGEAVVALAKLPDAFSLGWCLRVADQRHWQDASTIRKAVLGTAMGQPALNRIALGAIAADAARALAADEPTRLTEELRLAVEAGDAWACRALLDGLLRSGRAEAAAVSGAFGLEAKPAGRWPNAECAALALLVAVRAEPARAGELCDRLAGIALGQAGEAMATPLRVQAAWLSLRASGEDRVALARVLAEAQIQSGTDR